MRHNPPLATKNAHQPSQSSPFNRVADDYDRTFSQSPVGLMQRQCVHKFLAATVFGKSLNILEINCGTGDDAIWLAEKGHHVTATDASGQMLEVTKGKIESRALQSRIAAKQASFKEIKEHFQRSSYDLIFSDFGGLNCIPKDELQMLMNDVSCLLKPGGKFVAVIMGRRCLWERIYFLWKGKSGEAFRRNSNQPVKVLLGDEVQQTWYYSPGEIRVMSSTQFKLKKLKPVGIMIPPSYLNTFFDKRKALLSVLGRLESVFSFSIFSNYADHFYIALQKIK